MNNAVEITGSPSSAAAAPCWTGSTSRSVGESPGCWGPSGCGKTTLMRCLVGVQQIVGRGHGARPGGRQRPAARPHRLPHAGGERVRRPDRRREPDVLRPGPRPRPVGRRPGDRRRSTSRTPPTRWWARMSGGQRSRASLAVALLGDPDLLVLDEPTVGLDPVLRQQLWQLFHRLADAGSAVLVSSHVMDEAERCDRLLLMREGAVIADGTPAEIRDRTGRSTSRRPSSRSWEARRHEHPDDHRGRRRPGARPAASRPPHDGHAAAPADAADDPAVVDVPGHAGGRVRPDRPEPAGAVPLLHHVPGHQRHDAARALQRHPRTAAADADGQARLPVRLRARLRPDGRPAGRDRGRGQRRSARHGRHRSGLAARRRGGRRRRARHRRWACS